MSRVVNPDSTGRQRTQLTKAIVLAVRELARQTDAGVAGRSPAIMGFGCWVQLG